MRQFQIQACVLFDRPYQQSDLFDETTTISRDTSTSDPIDDDQPLIGYYSTYLVSAQMTAEAVHYVEEQLLADEDMPQSRIFDIACTEVQLQDLEPDIRSSISVSPDVPGIFYEGEIGFFSEIEMEHHHPHEH